MDFLMYFLGIIYSIAALISLFIFTALIITSLPTRLEKDKIIRLIYVATCSSILFYLFLYPISKEKSIIEKRIYHTIYCNIEITYTSNAIDLDIEKKFQDLSMLYRSKNCSSKTPLISLNTQIINLEVLISIITIFLFIFSIIAVFLTRKYSVCLYYFNEKIIKKLFKKI